MIAVTSDSQFVVGQHITDKKWRWHWLGGLLQAGVVVQGTRGYLTKAGCVRGAKASIERLTRYCARMNQGDMV